MQSTCKDRLSNTISPSLVPARLAVGFGPKELSPSPSSASWRFTRGPSERSNVGPHPRRAAGDSVFLGILLSPGGIRTRWVVVNVLDHLIHPSAWKVNSSKFAFTAFSEVRSKGVGLLLDHRLGWLSGRYGVCVPMHDLPSTILGPKDASNPQGNRGGILRSADLGLEPLHLYEVCKLSTHVLRCVLEVGELAICIVRCCTLQGPSNLIPPKRGRAEGVGEGYVFSMGAELLITLRIPFNDLAQR